MSTLVEDAYRIARMLHAGQRDADRRLHIEHLMRVAQALSPYGEVTIAAGLLHDVIADTGVLPSELVDDGIPREVVLTVAAVTRWPGENLLRSYLPRVINAGRDAVLVAGADLTDLSRDPIMGAEATSAHAHALRSPFPQLAVQTARLRIAAQAQERFFALRALRAIGCPRF